MTISDGSGWDGRGLPPAVQTRIDRARASGVASSLLSVPGQAGLESCGFTPVGEVMGCIVEHIGFQGYGGCGMYGYGTMGYGSYGSAPTRTSGSGGIGGFAPYVEALYAGWDTALGRMLTEARELGADGVVDVRLDEHHLGNANREFVALGTAVHAIRGPHLERPFTTTLPGQDVAKLFHSGWAPAAIIVGISVGIRHDDYQTIMASRAFAPNMEIAGFTELVNHARADARHQLSRRVQAIGADGIILSSDVALSVHEIEVSEGHRDHIAESSAQGSAIVRFHPENHHPPRPTMTISLGATGPTSRRRL